MAVRTVSKVPFEKAAPLALLMFRHPCKRYILLCIRILFRLSTLKDNSSFISSIRVLKPRPFIVEYS